MSKKTIKIGNAGGYWGDDQEALYRQVFGGKLDYISMDFLAEITMSIMQKQMSRDPEAGYARDFIPMLASVIKKTMADGTTIITNAGGVNPEACAKAIKDMAKEQGLDPKIAVVYGDDIKDKISELVSADCSFQNMETGEDFSLVKDKLKAANIYFGAAPVVEALKWNPDIIITGRVTDTGITIAPMIHEFGWSLSDFDKLATGIVAGHILECGCQSTGGNFTDWEKVPSFENIGYPIAEVSEDGSLVITKHENTGGLVSVDTIREQLFYEMGNPSAYLTPDVVADFTTIKLAQEGDNRVAITGVKGFEPTPFYKVSMAYEDGFKSQGGVVISGPNAVAKSKKFAEIFWQRAGTEFEATDTELFGYNACHRSLNHESEGNEILLRLGVRTRDKEALKRFGKFIPALILSGPPGVAVLGGVPRPQEVVSYWPALIPKELVKPMIALYDGGLTEIQVVDTTAYGNFEASSSDIVQVAETATESIDSALSKTASGKPLSSIALGRSGDKGDMCNIGILARDEKSYSFIKENITAQAVKNMFQELCEGPVVRYELENMQGFNFLLEKSLGGGGTKTLRTDAQGKTFAQALLSQKFDI